MGRYVFLMVFVAGCGEIGTYDYDQTVAQTVASNGSAQVDCSRAAPCLGNRDWHSAAPLVLRGCSSIEGRLEIEDNRDVTQLTGLECITSISESLDIFDNTFTSLAGLENLRSVGGRVRIQGNLQLESLAGLENLTSIGELLWVEDNALTNFVELGNLTSLGGLVVQTAPKLTNFVGLEGITTTKEIFVNINDNITDFTGLDNLRSVDRFEFLFNRRITDLRALSNLTTVRGTMSIHTSKSLTSLRGLENLRSVGRHLHIVSMDSLSDLRGLENLESVGEKFVIRDSDKLTSLTGLKRLSSIGLNLEILRNTDLASLSGLENIRSVGRDLLIRSNPSLASLTGLENIRSVERDLLIRDNENLVTLAALDSLVHVGRDFTIEENSKLGNLLGSDSLSTIGRLLTVQNNSELPACEATNLAAQVGVPCKCTNNSGDTANCSSFEEAGRILADFPACTNPELISTLASACGARHRQTVITAARFGDSSPPEIAVGRTYRVRLVEDGAANEGLVSFTAPATDTYALYLGTPNIPVHIDAVEPSCALHVGERRVQRITGGQCRAFRGVYLLPPVEVGTKVRIRLGRINPQRWVGLLVLPRNPPTHWAQRGRSPRRSSYNPHESVLTADTVGDLQIMWATPTGARFFGPLTGLIVRENRVFVNAGDLLAFDRASGSKLWTGTLPGVSGTPAYAAGSLFSRGENAVEGMRASSGHQTFRFPVPEMDFTVSNPLTAQLATEAAVFVLARANANPPLSSAFLFANAARSGASLFPPKELPFSDVADPAAANGNIFVAGDGLLVVLDAHSGMEQWRRSVKTDNRGLGFGPVVHGGRVFVPHSFGVSAMDEDTREVLWTQSINGTIAGRLAVTFNHVYIVSNVPSGGVLLRAYTVDRGRPAFSAVIGTGKLMGGGISIAANVVYMNHDDGRLFAIHAVTGSVLRVIHLGSGQLSSPAVTAGQAYVTSGMEVFSLGLPPL